MIVLRNLVVVFSFLVFASVVNAANGQSTSTRPIVSSNKTVVFEEASIKPVNINSADVKALQKVKGIGKRTAEEIVKYRAQQGAFKSVEDLLKIKCRSINRKWLERVGKLLTV